MSFVLQSPKPQVSVKANLRSCQRHLNVWCEMFWSVFSERGLSASELVGRLTTETREHLDSRRWSGSLTSRFARIDQWMTISANGGGVQTLACRMIPTRRT